MDQVAALAFRDETKASRGEAVTEEWRPIISYGGHWSELYSASSEGHIRRNDSGKVLAQHFAGRERKYLYVRLARGPRIRTCPVHVLVGEAFHGLRPPKGEINHINGNQRDNRPANLEHATRASNKKHAVAHAHMGLIAWGEGHGMHKLTAAQVYEIRAAKKYRGYLDVLAHQYGVTRMCIQDVRARRTWHHLPDAA